MPSLQLATPPPVSPTVRAIFPRVLLGIDFGAASLAAARWATSHVASDADAVLVHVMPSTDRPSNDVSFENAHDAPARQMKPALIGGLGGLGAILSVASARSIVRAGRPSASLAAIANDSEASLMVLGRRADANRVRVGEPNVIERAARRTSASVLVVPEGTAQAPAHVVAAVDESRFAPHVLEIAGRLARMHEIPLTLLHVTSPAFGAYERVVRSAKHLLSRVVGPVALARQTTRWLAELRRTHTVTGRDATELAIGDPVREIVRMAMKHESTLVVVGMRGADEAPPGSVGSVTRELLTRGPMPVLAVNAI